MCSLNLVCTLYSSTAVMYPALECDTFICEPRIRKSILEPIQDKFGQILVILYLWWPVGNPRSCMLFNYCDVQQYKPSHRTDRCCDSRATCFFSLFTKLFEVRRIYLVTWNKLNLCIIDQKQCIHLYGSWWNLIVKIKTTIYLFKKMGAFFSRFIKPPISSWLKTPGCYRIQRTTCMVT